MHLRKTAPSRMHQFIALIFAVLCSMEISAQWTLFNKVHPVSCQNPPFNYTAHGYFENVFVVDSFNNFYDGYLMFGNGILCNPDSVNHSTRCFGAKCNRSGDLMWWHRFDNDSTDISEEWANWPEGNYGGMVKNNTDQIVSIFSTFGDGSSTQYLVKMDNECNIEGFDVIDSSYDFFGLAGLIHDSIDNSYVGHGYYADSLTIINQGDPKAILLKMDSVGNTIWLKTYPSAVATYDVVKSMDGGFWICAITPLIGDCGNSGFFNTDLLLIKTDSMGNVEDEVQLGGACAPEKATVYEYEEDKIVLAGYRSADEIDASPYVGNLYTTLIAQNEDGSFTDSISTKNYFHTPQGSFTDFLKIPSGGYYMTGAGYFETTPNMYDDRINGFILRLDDNRDSLWLRAYKYFNNAPGPNGLTEHYILDSKLTPDGGLVCCGWIQQKQQDPNPMLQTPWIFKVDSLGCLEPGCQYVHVAEMVIGLENTMSIYPNPADDIAHISFSFPANYSPPQHSELVVIDMQGKEVARQELTLAGVQQEQIELNVVGLASGIYTAHWISAGQWLDSVKLVKE